MAQTLASNRARARAYYWKNRKRILAYQRKCYKQNYRKQRAKRLSYQNDYYVKHRAERLRYWAKNKAKIANQRREFRSDKKVWNRLKAEKRAWYFANRKRVLAQKRARRRSHLKKKAKI